MLVLGGWVVQQIQELVQAKANQNSKGKKKKDSCWIKSLAAWSVVLKLGKGGNAMLRLLLTVAAWA